MEIFVTRLQSLTLDLEKKLYYLIQLLKFCLRNIKDHDTFRGKCQELETIATKVNHKL